MARRSDDQSELTFHDLMSDPMIRKIMEADGVDERELRELFDRANEQQPLQPTEVARVESVETTPEPLRRGVGIMLVNRDRRVFVGQRIDMSDEAWQMPQGGIDPGETPRAASLRELREEVGTANADVVVGTHDWLSYELPMELREKIPTPYWWGQNQQWFLMRFRGADDEIDVATEHPEFSAWKWVPAVDLLDLIVPFKRDLYRRVLKEFAPYLAGSPPGI